MNKVQEILEKYEGDLCDICYKIIEESVDLENDFEYLCENWSKDTNESKNIIETHIFKEERDLFNVLYEKKVDGIISEIITKINYGILDQNEFYVQLLNQLKVNFIDPKELAVAFERVVQDRRVPFRYLGKPVSMESEKFKEYIDKNIDNFNKIVYILQTNYSQKTQEASLLLNVLESIKDYEERVVVLAQMIDILKRGGVAGIIRDLIMRGESDEHIDEE